MSVLVGTLTWESVDVVLAAEYMYLYDILDGLSFCYL